MDTHHPDMAEAMREQEREQRLETAHRRNVVEEELRCERALAQQMQYQAYTEIAGML